MKKFILLFVSLSFVVPILSKPFWLTELPKSKLHDFYIGVGVGLTRAKAKQKAILHVEYLINLQNPDSLFYAMPLKIFGGNEKVRSEPFVKKRQSNDPKFLKIIDNSDMNIDSEREYNQEEISLFQDENDFLDILHIL